MAEDSSCEGRPFTLPPSGPIARYGRPAMLATGLASQLACLLNPYQLTQVLRQVAGNRRLQERERDSGDDGTSYETKARYSLPFSGCWLVAGGGVTPGTSHSWEILGQRFALDFVQADTELRRHTGSGTRPEEYRCYGAEIVAAADGVVSCTENGVGRSPFLGWAVRDFTARDFVGNHVIIEHAAGEFALYAHLIEGSVTVRRGERVGRGQVVGRCGHSGHSSEPHLHFHLQDSADLWNGMGLPVRFHDLLVDGGPADGVHLTAGNRVERAHRASGCDELPVEQYPEVASGSDVGYRPRQEPGRHVERSTPAEEVP